MSIFFRPMKPGDWKEVAAIFKQGMDTNNATFDKEIPTCEEWDKAHVASCRIVAEIENTVVGWAALSPISPRVCFKGVAELSIYINAAQRGLKIGTMLLEQLILESEREGFWTLQAGIFPENYASIRLHKSLGFREIGYREKIGKMNNAWRNIVLLERRSPYVGVK